MKRDDDRRRGRPGASREAQALVARRTPAGPGRRIGKESPRRSRNVDLLLPGVDRDREQLEAVRPERPVEALHRGHLALAGLAPRRPEVHENERPRSSSSRTRAVARARGSAKGGAARPRPAARAPPRPRPERGAERRRDAAARTTSAVALGAGASARRAFAPFGRRALPAGLAFSRAFGFAGFSAFWAFLGLRGLLRPQPSAGFFSAPFAGAGASRPRVHELDDRHRRGVTDALARASAPACSRPGASRSAPRAGRTPSP